MKFNHYFFFFTLFLVPISLYSQDSANQPMRNVIILLDQEEDVEHMGNPHRFFLTNKLQTAIEQKACPIIVNAALWSVFIEKRKSIEQMSQIPDTDEQNALSVYNTIIERLNYWYNHFLEKGFSPFESKQLMLETVNDEFYTKEKKEEKDIVSHPLMVTLISYLTRFNKDEWEVYQHPTTPAFYVLVPKTYLEELEKQEPQHAAINNISKKEMMLGLKIDHLTPIADSEDVGRCQLDAHCPGNTQFSNHLADFFVTKEDIQKDTLPYKWNVVFSGHGGCEYKEQIDDTTNKVTVEAHPIIADLRPSQFLDLQTFLQNKIDTHCLLFSSCYGTGMHTKLLFDDNNNARYNYTIISDCLSDAFTYCLWKQLKFPSYEGNQLNAQDIEQDKEGKWHLSCDQHYRWEKFFTQLSTHSFTDSNFSWLLPALLNITLRRLCCTSSIRFAQTQSFVPVLPHSVMLINDRLIQLKQAEQKNLVVKNETEAILVQSSSVPPVTINNTTNPLPRMISLKPGTSHHYFEQITCKTDKGLNNMFWPLDGDRFERLYLISKMIFLKKSPIWTEKFGVTTNQVILKNMLAHAKKGRLLRIYLQTEQDKNFLVTFNKVDEWSNDTDVKGIHELTPEATQTYLRRFDQLKTALLAKNNLLA